MLHFERVEALHAWIVTDHTNEGSPSILHHWVLPLQFAQIHETSLPAIQFQTRAPLPPKTWTICRCHRSSAIAPVRFCLEIQEPRNWVAVEATLKMFSKDTLPRRHPNALGSKKLSSLHLYDAAGNKSPRKWLLNELSQMPSSIEPTSHVEGQGGECQ